MIAVRLLAEGVVVREVVFRDGPVVIGRAPESDFVVVDPSVSRRHALVHADEHGALWIEDTDSRNGLRVGGQVVPRSALKATEPLRCRLGAVDLELAPWSAEVTQEIAAEVRDPRQGPRALGLWAAGIAAGASAVLVEPGFWSPWEPDRLTGIFRITLGLAVGLPVCAFVLIGLLRIAGRKARVVDAMRALALASWGSVLVRLLVAGATYVLSVEAHSVVAVLLPAGATVVIVAGLASIARPGPRRRFFATWVAAVAVLIFAIGALGAMAARQAGMPVLDYTVGAPILGVTGPATDLDGYLEDVSEGFAAAEERAGEERRRSDEATGRPSR